MRSNDWTLQNVWNATLEKGEERPTEERDHLWASELGRAPIELFLKLRGVTPTNPPNPRSRRKFEAGIMFEGLVELVLMRCGILKESQKWTKFQYPGTMAVTGRCDFIAGGIPDHEHWREQTAAFSAVPGFNLLMRQVEALMGYFLEKYPQGLGDKFLEIKSTSSFIFDAMDKTKKSQKAHRLQLFHYLRGENYPYGNIVYICRDDLRMLEFPVVNPSEKTEDEYRRAIEVISAYYDAHKETPLKDFLLPPDSSDVLKWEYNPAGIEGLPELEKAVVFDEDLGKFSRNWNIEYSNYLTMLYGYQTQKEFENAVKPIVARWNRVMGRLANGATMTDKNKLVLDEILEYGLEPEAIAKHFVDGEDESE